MTHFGRKTRLDVKSKDFNLSPSPSHNIYTSSNPVCQCNKLTLDFSAATYTTLLHSAAVKTYLCDGVEVYAAVVTPLYAVVKVCRAVADLCAVVFGGVPCSSGCVSLLW